MGGTPKYLLYHLNLVLAILWLNIALYNYSMYVKTLKFIKIEGT